MASVVSDKTETVEGIFRSMSFEEEFVNIYSLPRFKIDCLPDVTVLSSEFYSTVLSSEKLKKPEIVSSRIEKLLNLLEQNKNDLLSLLVKLKFTWNNALLIFNRFIDCIKFYEIQYNINPCLFKSGAPFINGGKDVLLAIQNIAKSFFAANRTVMICLSFETLLPFYCSIAKLCDMSGFDDRFLIVALDADIYELSLCLNTSNVVDTLGYLVSSYNNTSRPYPVIITEDADISAAADCISKSICQSQLQESSLLSYIFIQESIYKQAVSVLKDKLSLIKHGSRLDKRTKLELSANESNDAPAKLEVFSPCEHSSIKLCIGWNPKDIDKGDIFSNDRGYITVVPYRNITDIKTLLKDNIKHLCPVAVWSERIDAIKMDLGHMFSAVWFNCQGLLHPLALSNTPCNALHGVNYSINRDDDSASQEKFIELKKDLIKKMYLNWQKRKISVQIKLLNLLKKTGTDCESCRFNFKMDCNNWELFENSEYKGVSSKPRCSFTVKPVGMILIFCNFPSMTPTLTELLRKVVITAIFNGNVVIVGGDVSLLSSCQECLKDLQFLLEGVLTFHKESNPNIFLFSFGHFDSYLGIFMKINDSFIDIIDYCFLGKQLKITSDYLCNEVLNDLTTITQSTWIA